VVTLVVKVKVVRVDVNMGADEEEHVLEERTAVAQVGELEDKSHLVRTAVLSVAKKEPEREPEQPQPLTKQRLNNFAVMFCATTKRRKKERNEIFYDY